MKKLLFILVTISSLYMVTSCSKNEQEPQKWEYKTLTVWGDSYSDFGRINIVVPQAEMDTLGAHGWELVDVYTRIETVHPNFGNDKYVTGLQPNTRTHGVFYVFKRLKQHNEDSTDTKNSKYVVIVGQDEEVEVHDTGSAPETTAN